MVLNSVGVLYVVPAATVPWQDTVTAVGTLAAVLVAVAVAITESVRAARANRSLHLLEQSQQREIHLSAARLVSAWVEETYTPNEDASCYRRISIVHVANEGAQPVFNVVASIGLGYPTYSIGPLAIPQPIPVLPPRRELTWDISEALRAHDDVNAAGTFSPCAEMGFTDPLGNRWRREFDGALVEVPPDTKAVLVGSQDEETALQQLGQLTNIENPMGVVFAFLRTLLSDDEPVELGDILPFLAEEAAGWGELSEDAFQDLRNDLATCGVGSQPWYPTPRVAYVKVFRDTEDGLLVTVGEGTEVPVRFLTLTYVPDRGWRLFAFGDPTPPHRIRFPTGSLASD